MSDASALPGIEPVLWRFLVMAGVGVVLGWLLSDMAGGDAESRPPTTGRGGDNAEPPASPQPKGPRTVRVVTERVEIHGPRKGSRASRAVPQPETPEHKE